MLQRYLDSLESSLLGIASSHVYEYRGALDIDALSKAWYLLCKKHAVLRARVKATGAQFLLYVPGNQFPDLDVVSGGGRDFLVSYVNQAWDYNRGVSRLSVIEEGETGYVVFRADHAIADGGNRAAWSRVLWQNYTNVVSGHPPEVEASSVLPPAPTAVAERDSVKPASNYNGNGYNVDITGKLVEHNIKLGPAETDCIISAAKLNGVSVHGILCGAVLVSLRNIAADSEGSTRMLCNTLIDLRSRVDSSEGGELVTTNFLGLRVAAVDVPRNGDAIAIGKEVKRDLDDAVKNDDVRMFDKRTAESLDFPSLIERRLGVINVSNRGVVQELTVPSNLVICDYDAVVPPRDAGDVPIAVTAYTYGGRLRLKFFFSSGLFSSEEMGAVINGVRGEFAKIAGSR